MRRLVILFALSLSIYQVIGQMTPTPVYDASLAMPVFVYAHPDPYGFGASMGYPPQAWDLFAITVTEAKIAIDQGNDEETQRQWQKHLANFQSWIDITSYTLSTAEMLIRAVQVLEDGDWRSHTDFMHYMSETVDYYQKTIETLPEIMPEFEDDQEFQDHLARTNATAVYTETLEKLSLVTDRTLDNMNRRMHTAQANTNAAQVQNSTSSQLQLYNQNLSLLDASLNDMNVLLDSMMRSTSAYYDMQQLIAEQQKWTIEQIWGALSEEERDNLGIYENPFEDDLEQMLDPKISIELSQTGQSDQE
jgi:hypothetical protein